MKEKKKIKLKRSVIRPSIENYQNLLSKVEYETLKISEKLKIKLLKISNTIVNHDLNM